MHLFVSVIKPVLLYGSDVWGFTNGNTNIFSSLINDVLEKYHLSYCRYILGVFKNTPRVGLYGEPGRYPLIIQASIQFIKQKWCRIANKKEESNQLLCKVYSENFNNLKGKNSWSTKVQDMLTLITVDSACVDSKPCSYLTWLLKQKLGGELRVGWKKALFCNERNENFGNKLRS